MSATVSPNHPKGGGLRLTMVLPLAAVVTAGLFLMMGGLIQNDIIEVTPVAPTPPITFKREIIDTGPIEPVDQPRPPEEVPPEPTIKEWPASGPDGSVVGPPVPVTPTDPGGGTITGLTLSGAIITILPTYPDRCAARGLEGSVTVRFDVSAAGDVVNAQVISSSDRCFERAALDAIRKWKFHASQGAGITSRGLIKTFDFKLQG